MRLILSLILLICFTISSTNSTFGQENSTPSSSLKNQKSTYTLAYPGILPDHPFYKLKVLRTKIISLLINDPKKKIEFYLLETDKGIAASKALADKGETPLALETALKAEHNFTLITYEVKKYPYKIEEKHYEKLKDASIKHQEVLKEIRNKVPEKMKKDFDNVIYFSEKNQKEIENTVKTLRENLDSTPELKQKLLFRKQ